MFCLMYSGSQSGNSPRTLNVKYFSISSFGTKSWMSKKRTFSQVLFSALLQFPVWAVLLPIEAVFLFYTNWHFCCASTVFASSCLLTSFSKISTTSLVFPFFSQQTNANNSANRFTSTWGNAACSWSTIFCPNSPMASIFSSKILISTQFCKQQIFSRFCRIQLWIFANES